MYKYINRVGVGVAVCVSALLVWAGVAYAQMGSTTTEMGDAFNSATGEGRSWITTYGVPALFAFALIFLVAGIAFALMRKPKQAASSS